MTYGTISTETREWLERRARESGVVLEKLGLDYATKMCGEFPVALDGEVDETGWCNRTDVHGDDEHEFTWELDSDVYLISVICEGALDEEFMVKTIYEVNIADWIAELLARTEFPTDFTVMVTDPINFNSGDGTVRYQVTEES